MRIRPRSAMRMHSGNNLHRWTVSFADFMTLMFAVFVVLYAVAVNDKAQYKEVMQSIQNASKLLNKSLLSSSSEGILTHNSNNLVEDAGPALLSDAMPHKAHDELSQQTETFTQATDQLSEVKTLKSGQQLSQLKAALATLFTSEVNDASIALDLNGDWLTVEMGGDILFPAGSHTLLHSAHDVVEKIAQVLLPVDNLLRIRGYSDSEKISNEIYRSNWELSGMRAFSVLHALNAQGIAGERMVIEAYGRFSPVLNEQNHVDLLKSRRVVIAISRYAVLKVDKKSELSAQQAAQSSNSLESRVPKQDSTEMREVHLPNNRLIITTRQE